MKKILILSPYKNPFPAVASQRIAGWSKYFHQFDIHPVIVTLNRKSDPGTYSEYLIQTGKPVEMNESSRFSVIRVPLKSNVRDYILCRFGTERLVLLRKIASFIQLNGCYFIPQLSSEYYLYTAAERYLQKNNVFAIIATGEPYITFKIAANLSRKFGTPWVADYRDAWSGNYDYRFGFQPIQGVRRWYLKMLERHFVGNSALVVTASPVVAQEIKKIFPRKKIEAIPNGFDRDEIREVDMIKPEKSVFTITYAGSIYKFQRLDVFLRGFCSFISANRNHRITLRFYGLNRRAQMEVLRLTKGYEEFISINEWEERGTILRKLKASHILLLLASDRVDGYCTKVYEYLALSRKILLCVNDGGTLEGLMNACNAGVICQNELEVSEKLQLFYNEFLSSGNVEQKTIDYSEFDKEMLVKEYSGHLASLL